MYWKSSGKFFKNGCSVEPGLPNMVVSFKALSRSYVAAHTGGTLWWVAVVAGEGSLLLLSACHCSFGSETGQFLLARKSAVPAWVVLLKRASSATRICDFT